MVLQYTPTLRGQLGRCSIELASVLRDPVRQDLLRIDCAETQVNWVFGCAPALPYGRT